MMSMSEAEVMGLLQFAVRHTATTLGSSDVDWKSVEELLEEIHATDVDTHSLLVTFIDAYLDWYRFHQRMDRQGKQGNLDPEELADLHKKIEQRDSTRQAILKKLRSVKNDAV